VNLAAVNLDRPDHCTEKDRPDARDFGDWTRKGPLPELANARQGSNRGGFGSGDRGGGDRGFGVGRSFDNISEAGSERPGRRPYEQSESRVPSTGNWERKGPLTPTLPPNHPVRGTFERPSSKDGPRDRRNSPAPAWGEGRSQDGSRPPRREFSDRPVPERTPTAAEQDSQWRSKMRPDPPAAPAEVSPAASNKEISVPSSPVPAALPTPTTRPKLNLAKRTVSTAEPSPALPTGTSDSKANPFGAARPIDTAAREREIEEKLKAKKEQDEKAREEKRLADEKAKEERKAAKDAERAAQKDKPANGKSKEGEADGPAAKKYEILRRTTGEDGADAEEAQNGDANGVVTDDKETKPKELVRDLKKPNGETAPASAEAMEDEGWSTVSKPVKGRKNGNQGARALAS
jgi:translation initiation factor 4B